MSIPIPHYLKPISVLEKQTEQWTHFSIRCTCGCGKFCVFENTLTKEEEALIKPHYDAMALVVSPNISRMITRDENGEVHYWRLYEPLKGLEGRHEEIVIPPLPPIALFTMLKIVCDDCGEKFVLFDSRCHGYDGVMAEEEEKDAEDFSYQPRFRRKCRNAVSLSVKVENDESYEEFIENCGEEYTEEQYADAFSWIVIYKVDENGKKTKIFDYETA